MEEFLEKLILTLKILCYLGIGVFVTMLIWSPDKELALKLLATDLIILVILIILGTET